MKTKIAFFIESLNFGGAEKSFLSLVNHLNPDKYLIDVIVINKKGALEKNLPDYINYKSLDPQYSSFARFKYWLYRKFYSKRHNAQFFWKSFKNEFQLFPEKYDLAIAWGQGFATYFTADKFQAKYKCAWINIDYDKAGYIFKHDQYIYEKFDLINGVSPFVNDVMAKYVSKEKLIHIPNIIDIEDVVSKSLENCPITFKDDFFNIVSLGRLAKQKAFHLSIKAAKQLKEKGVQFHWYIVGDGSERPFLEELRRDLDLENEITFTGFQHNPYSFVKQGDLYVQTSIFEGLGRTLIEAAMLGKPIVTTDFETAYDLVDQNKTGIITPKNPEAIAAAILEIYQNVNLFQEMKKNQASSSRISAKNVVEQFDNMVEKLLQEKYIKS